MHLIFSYIIFNVIFNIFNIVFNIICTGGNTRIILGSGILGSKVLADLYLPLNSVDPDTVYGKVNRESEKKGGGEEIRGVKRGRDEKIQEEEGRVEEEVENTLEVKSKGQGLGDGDFIAMPETEDGE